MVHSRARARPPQALRDMRNERTLMMAAAGKRPTAAPPASALTAGFERSSLPAPGLTPAGIDGTEIEGTEGRETEGTEGREIVGRETDGSLIDESFSFSASAAAFSAFAASSSARAFAIAASRNSFSDGAAAFFIDTAAHRWWLLSADDMAGMAGPEAGDQAAADEHAARRSASRGSILGLERETRPRPAPC